MGDAFAQYRCFPAEQLHHFVHPKASRYFTGATWVGHLRVVHRSC
jgi:hypothetical protein